MIMILSGTLEGREIVSGLVEKKLPVMVSTATAYGGSLIPPSEHCTVLSKKLSEEEMRQLFHERQVKVLVDVTHPYAAEVSQNAMKACQALGIVYFRYHRQDSVVAEEESVMRFPTYEMAADYLAGTDGNILLATGSKTLGVFTGKISRERIFPRILPTSQMVEKCEGLGIKPSNIIAMQGPFSQAMNVEMIKMYNIRYLVTKDSGDVGGTKEKLMAAALTNTRVIMIERPQIDYVNVYENIGELIDKVSEVYAEILSDHGRFVQ
ncbi:MAG: precorrin-6A reductase [Bacillota bacterium]